MLVGGEILSFELGELSERKRLILKAIIDSHIQNGEPVGSKYLAESKQIACSSATIRNEMAELEASGYLEQPHSSAGRVPSEKGYRFYVDSLMQEYDMTSSEIAQLNMILGAKHAEADSILESATKVMSLMTNYTGLTVKTRSVGIAAERFDTMYIDQSCFALIILTSTGQIKTKKLLTGHKLAETDVANICRALNDTLVRISAREINVPIMIELERRLNTFPGLANTLVKTVYDMLSESEGSELKYSGVNKLLEYPEFSDTEKLKHLLTAFDNKSGLLDVVSRAVGNDTNIIIGSENPLNEMNDSSLILQTIRIGGKPVGAIGIVGPRRMDYARVCAMVKYIAEAFDGSMGNGTIAPPDNT